MIIRDRHGSRGSRIWPMMVAVLCMGATELMGQYFGRNKVQYEQFDFKETQTPHFRVFHYTTEGPAIRDAVKMLERWHERQAAVFGDSLGPNQPVVIYANHADFQQTNISGGLIPQGTGGFTESRANRIVLPLTGVYADNDHVLGHELTHAFHYRIMKESRRKMRGGRGIPLWFIEGMAEY
ncbi:MAG: peptidase S9, partial [Chitinivibrionales bacterium]|nr:peptidase S9 [Chitinivibrionales bacterium]